jgi:hypothetical protein
VECTVTLIIFSPVASTQIPAEFVSIVCACVREGHSCSGQPEYQLSIDLGWCLDNTSSGVDGPMHETGRGAVDGVLHSGSDNAGHTKFTTTS